MNIEPKLFFHLLSDETRLRCLMLIQAEGELCVCELTHALDVIQPKISRHLAMLRDAGVVEDRRQGQWIYYQIHPELADWACEILMTTARVSIDRLPFANDLVALQNMPNRPSAACCA